MRYVIFIVLAVSGFTQCVQNATAAPKAAAPKVQAKETRKRANQISKALLAKLKAQALVEARAELERETAAREAARLEALEELNAEPVDSDSADSAE